MLREKTIAEIKARTDPLDAPLKPVRPVNEPVATTPALKDVIGKALPYIGTYKHLDNKKQVVALIDDVRIFSAEQTFC